MFICVGPQRRRLHMSMSTVYSEDHMYEQAIQFLSVEHVTHVIHATNGTKQQVCSNLGVFLEFAPACFTRVQCETELRFVSRLVTLFHDQLRTESEQLSINENEWFQQDTALLEEAVAYHMLEPDSGESETDSYNGDDEKL